MMATLSLDGTSEEMGMSEGWKKAGGVPLQRNPRCTTESGGNKLVFLQSVTVLFVPYI